MTKYLVKKNYDDSFKEIERDIISLTCLPARGNVSTLVPPTTGAFSGPPFCWLTLMLALRFACTLALILFTLSVRFVFVFPTPASPPVPVPPPHFPSSPVITSASPSTSSPLSHPFAFHASSFPSVHWLPMSVRWPKSGYLFKRDEANRRSEEWTGQSTDSSRADWLILSDLLAPISFVSSALLPAILLSRLSIKYRSYWKLLRKR